VPFQNSFNFGVDPGNALQYNLNVQPVLLFKLNDDWNLISRSILPLTYQPEISPGLGDVFCLGDLQEQLYLSPGKPCSFIRDVGPLMQFPTASNTALGTGKWDAGPGAVGLTIQGPRVVGALINNIWSFAGSGDRQSFSLVTLQPFGNYNTPGGWYLVSSPILTANWQSGSGNIWTVPVAGGLGKISTSVRSP
jgi:hypothetical protein